MTELDTLDLSVLKVIRGSVTNVVLSSGKRVMGALRQAIGS